MRSRTGRDKLLLLATLPLFLAAFTAHLIESDRTGLAQLPVFAAWQPGDHPRVGGYRLETPSGGSGLELGDRLIRLGDRDLLGQGYVGFQAIALSLTSPGRPVPLEFERDGERHTVSLEARPHPQPWSRVPILLLIPAVCVLLLLRAPGQPEVQRFYLCFMTYAIGQAQFYGGPVWQTWLWHVVWVPASVLMLFFMLRWVRLFPSEMPDARRVPAAVPWAFAALYVVFVRANYIVGWPLPTEWVPRVSFASHAVLSLLGICILAWNYAWAYPAGRRRLRWILLGTALGSVPVIVANIAPLVAPEWQGFPEAFGVGFLASGIWMMGAMLGVVRDNAFDVDRLIGDTAAGAMAVAGVVAGLAIGVPALSAGVSDVFGVEPTVARIALAAVLGAMAIPAVVRLRPQVDRVLFPGRVTLQKEAARLVEDLAHCETPEVVLERAAGRSATLLGAEGFAVYARQGERFVRRTGSGPPALPPGFEPPADVRPRNAASELAPASIVVPVRAGDGADALLCLHPKRSGDIYTTNDATILAGVAVGVEREWLRLLKLAADRDSRAKTDLLAAASHDLRQPLHAVSLLAEALRGRLGDPETRELVSRIGDSTQELDEMLTGLLDRSRIDAGGVRPEVRDVALGELFSQLEREFEPQAAAAGVRLRVVPTRITVRSDRTLLARILRNLVSNAFRYGAGASVLVGARARGDRVLVEVRDGGPGIPPERQREIFDAFHQLPRDEGVGLGLGLSIVEGLAGILGHELSLRSQPGRGSTFAVRVERAPAASPSPAEVGIAAPSPAVKRVLVIDDDASVRHATAELLCGWGCDVRATANRAQALAAVSGEWRPDLAVADYHLADGELGTSVIEELRRALGVPLRAVILMAETTPEELEALRSAGDPVLRKPLRPARLRSLLAAGG